MMGKIVKVLLYLWQLPQNIIGLIMKMVLPIDAFGNVGDVVYYVSSKMSGGVTLGEYIFLSINSSEKKLTRQHEYGHVKQSRMLGPLYLFVIGIPSITRAAFNLYKDYYKFYTESWADKLGGITRDEQGNRMLKDA